ncbi:MAG: lectin-like protein [Patescibacteria group bacterium]|jgi:hypothetical protein
MKKVLFTALACTVFSLPSNIYASSHSWVLCPLNGHYYSKTVSPVMTWNEAETEAISVGGHLATIRNTAEEEWILKTFPPERLWIGLTDSVSEGNWLWTSGEPVTYTNWSAGHPNNSSENQDFATIWGSPPTYPAYWESRSGYERTSGIIEITSLPLQIVNLFGTIYQKDLQEQVITAPDVFIDILDVNREHFVVSGKTDGNGKFTILADNWQDSTYIIRIRKTGYKTKEVGATLKNSSSTPFSTTLETE